MPEIASSERCLVPISEAPWQRDAAAVLAPVLSGGRPLSRAALSIFGARFDHDFSGVRVHTDSPNHALIRVQPQFL